MSDISKARQTFERLKSTLEPDTQKQERRVAAEKVVGEVRAAAAAARVKELVHDVREAHSYVFTIGGSSVHIYAANGAVYINDNSKAVTLDSNGTPQGWTAIDLEFDPASTSYPDGATKVVDALAKIIER